MINAARLHPTEGRSSIAPHPAVHPWEGSDVVTSVVAARPSRRAFQTLVLGPGRPLFDDIGNNIDATLDHTYGRKVNKVSTLPPEDPANHIERTDSTTGNVAWKDPLPGWIFMFDLTRAASDTSNDDNPPQVDSSFGVKGDYKMDRFTMATSFKYDMKRTTADVETFDLKLGWLAPRWDASMIYTFTKTLSEELNETYSIAIAFKYTL